MTHIVQIAPTIGPGSGVAGVAHALEREFIAAGATVERFTAAEAGGPPGASVARTPLATHLTRARNVVWFSTVGTRRARRFLAARPDAVSITHNDVMTGDIYVNHGLLQAAMRARGDYTWRMVRNPVHLFTALRDRIRYRGRTHRAVVALTTTEADAAAVDLRPRARADPRHPERRRHRAVPAPGCRGARAGPGEARRRRRPNDRRVHRPRVRAQGAAVAMAALRTAPDVLLLVVGGVTRHDPQGAGTGAAGRRRRTRALRGRAPRPDPLPLGLRHARAAERLRGERARRARGARVRPARGRRRAWASHPTSSSTARTGSSSSATPRPSARVSTSCRARRSTSGESGHGRRRSSTRGRRSRAATSSSSSRCVATATAASTAAATPTHDEADG